jgi:hypothetical protein
MGSAPRELELVGEVIGATDRVRERSILAGGAVELGPGEGLIVRRR